jgi:hypothetical protein
LFFISFVVVFYFDDITKNVHNEAVLNVEVETYLSYSRKTQEYEQIKLFCIETNISHFEAKTNHGTKPVITIGDTLIIKTNIFGKAIYFTKENWKVAYGLKRDFLFFLLFLLPTFISCFINNGLEPFTNKLLLVVSLADIFAIAFYFIDF